MSYEHVIDTPDAPALDALCRELAAGADQLDLVGDWPGDHWQKLARYGVLRWFGPRDCGGFAWDEEDLLRGYLRLGQSCLTTAFVLTQWAAAVRRLASLENRQIAQDLLPDLLSGRTFATVGISHLTTSRRHLGQAALVAHHLVDGFVLNGFSPWVTGAAYADTLVIGATLPDGRQILLAVPRETPGIAIGEPARLSALSASHTGEVRFENVAVPRSALLAGPVENVMAAPGAAGAGGLPTSALALGLASAAIEFLQQESQRRDDLRAPWQSLREELLTLQATLLETAVGNVGLPATDMRARSNSLVLRATQAALVAAKGTGFVLGHPAGRWCREALFFLVWSCPQPVLAANLCELAGLQQ